MLYFATHYELVTVYWETFEGKSFLVNFTIELQFMKLLSQKMFLRKMVIT